MPYGCRTEYDLFFVIAVSVLVSAVDLRQGHIYPGEPKQSHPAECTITIDEVDLVAMSTGRLYLPKVRFSLYCYYTIFM